MKRLLIFAGVIIVIILFGVWYKSKRAADHVQLSEKIYVAVEGEVKIVAFDPVTKEIVSQIDLSVEHQGGILPFAPHNVQVAPDMKTVWVTANAGTHQGHGASIIRGVLAHGDEEDGEDEDEVIIIDPLTDKILKRIPVEVGVHLAHVVLTPDNSYAYVTAQNEGTIYKINARTYIIEKRIVASKGSEPHGLRLAPDGSVAYLAMLRGKSLGILDLKTDALSEVVLDGQAVQTGITPDGKFVVASLYDTKQLAVYETATKKLWYVKLPESAKGPIQMYPTPDSKFMYLADQGYYFNQPASDWVYKIDLEKMEVVKEIKAGKAPHGVVVSPDGNFVYVTNLLSGDVSVIDTAAEQEVGRIKVGKEPNGISVWVKK